MNREPASYERVLLAFALFASGVAALVFEALWFRQARIAFGSTVWASALVTGSFMAGIGVGALIGFRLRTSPRGALLRYATLELAIAATGVGLVYAFPSLSEHFAAFAVQHEDGPWIVRAHRFALAFALLSVPSTAMGLTLPLALRSRVAATAPGHLAALFYGANTLGATVGALATELALLRHAGVQGAAQVAAGMSTLAALAGFASAQLAPSAAVTPVESPRAKRPLAQAKVYLGAAALVGFAMLAFETVWLRFLMLWVADTPLAFAAVLALVLCSIALGSLSAGVVLARRGAVRLPADLVAYTATIGGTLGLLSFPLVLARLFSFELGWTDIALLAAPLIVPVAWCSGALLPLLVAEAHDVLGGEARATAALTASNALGGAVGVLVSALWLLPALGMERAYLALSVLFAGTGLALTFVKRPRAPRSYGALAATLAALALFPHGAVEHTYVRGSVSRWLGEEDRVLSVREGLNATFVHVRHRRAGLDVFDQLASNSYSMATNDFAARRYMKLFAYLPRALHPRLERALIVGFGLGNTAEAVLSEPALQSLDVVDTSPETLALRSERVLLAQSEPLRDPRVQVHIEDGRHYLAGRDAQYDLITGEPPPPLLAGVEELYSREYFELVRSRLRKGGLATYWLPIINISAAGSCAVVNAFCEAFGDCTLWHGAGPNFMLMGSRGRSEAASLAHFMAPWTDSEERRELETIGLEHPVQLGALFIGDGAYLRGRCAAYPPLTDDYPRRLHARDEGQEREQLLADLRDTRAARARYLASEFVAVRFPDRARRDGSAQFENQRLFNDLLENNPNARSLGVLEQVLHATPWKLPVLLLLGSDSDVARELARSPSRADEPASLRRHRLARAVAQRDLREALALARTLPRGEQPIAGLDSLLEQLLASTQLTRSQ